jgi:hypothetical protein
VSTSQSGRLDLFRRPGRIPHQGLPGDHEQSELLELSIKRHLSMEHAPDCQNRRDAPCPSEQPPVDVIARFQRLVSGQPSGRRELDNPIDREVSHARTVAGQRCQGTRAWVDRADHEKSAPMIQESGVPRSISAGDCTSSAYIPHLNVTWLARSTAGACEIFALVVAKRLVVV